MQLLEWQLRRILRSLQIVERAIHASTALVQHVRVNHRRAHVFMPQQFLDRADIVAVFQQVRGERMTQGMRRGALDNRRVPYMALLGHPSSAGDHFVIRPIPAPVKENGTSAVVGHRV
jgi:hypothetical protein